MPGNSQNRTPVSSLLRTVASYLQPDMARNPNTAIAEVLDREERSPNGNGVDQSEEQQAKQLSSSDFYGVLQASITTSVHHLHRTAFSCLSLPVLSERRQTEKPCYVYTALQANIV